jgi:hypothetical protein
MVIISQKNESSTFAMVGEIVAMYKVYLKAAMAVL